jgi:PAS domain S-box-containing protein
VYTFDIHQDRQPTLAWVSNDQGRFTGYTAREIEASGGPLAIVHPEDRPMVQQTLAGLQNGDQASTEFRIVRKDGEVRWIHTASFPVLDPRLGRVTQIHGAARDVTERRFQDEALTASHEAKLRHGEERYRALFDNS